MQLDCEVYLSELNARIGQADALFRSQPGRRSGKPLEAYEELKKRAQVFEEGMQLKADVERADFSDNTVYVAMHEAFARFYRKIAGLDGSDDGFVAAIRMHERESDPCGEAVTVALASAISAFRGEGASTDVTDDGDDLLKILFLQYLNEILNYYMFYRDSYRPIPQPKAKKKTA